MKSMVWFFPFLCMALLLAVGCAPSQKEIPPEETYSDEPMMKRAADYRGHGPLGSSTNPVKCAGEDGALAYLKHLRGPNGQPLQWERADEAGMSPFGGVMMLFQVRWDGGEAQVFFDPDFGKYEERKPTGGLSYQ